MRLRYIYAIIATLLMCGSAFAQTTYYWYGEGNWSDVSHWYTDEEHSEESTVYPKTKNDKVVILPGSTCNQDLTTISGGIYVSSLEIRGTLNNTVRDANNNAIKVTTQGDLTIASGGEFNSIGVTLVWGNMYIKSGGTFSGDNLNNKVKKNLYLDGTISGKKIFTEILGSVYVTEPTAKIKVETAFTLDGDFIIGENAVLDLYGVNVYLYMANDKNVNFEGTVNYNTKASSIFVCAKGSNAPAKTFVKGSGIKVNIGDNSKFVSVKGSSNVFLFPEMLDCNWSNTDANDRKFRDFTYTKGSQRMKIYLLSRPEGELAFYNDPAVDDPTSSNWSGSNIWTLVQGHCVYVNVNNTTHYYPGKSSGVVDNAVIGENRKVNVNVSVAPSSVTINDINSLTGADNYLKATVPVYVKTSPSGPLTFTSVNGGNWRDVKWTFKEGKEWYVVNRNEAESINDTYVVKHDIKLDINKSIYKVIIKNNATLTKPCEFFLDAEIDDTNGRYVENNDGCVDWNEISEKVDGVVTFWSVGDGNWSDYHSWSVTDPSIKDAEGNPIVKSYPGIYPGKAEQEDKVVICEGNTIALDGDYTVRSLDVKSGATLSVATDRTLTITNSGAVTIDGTMTISNGVRVTMAGEGGHFAASEGSIQTETGGTSYIRCDWGFLSEICKYSNGKCVFVNGEDALAKYTSVNGGTVELSSRPTEFSFAAYKTANWDENKAWSVVAGNRIFLYLNNNFTETAYPGQNEGETDSFVIPEGITITHGIKVNSIASAEINGTLYLKEETLYPNNGSDLVVGADGKKHPIYISTLSGSGIVNEEYVYSAKIVNKTAFERSKGLFVVRKLDSNTTFYSIGSGSWSDYKVWSTKRNGSPIEGQFPGSTHIQGDEAIICEGHTITNNDDIALSNIKVESGGHLINKKSIRLVINDENFQISEGGKFEVAESSSLTFLGDGQNLQVGGTVIFNEGKILSVTGNKNVLFGANGKFEGKGGIRISYDNIIRLVDGKPHTTFQSILNANSKLDAFLAQGGIMEMTARPNKGKSMAFYLQKSGNWKANERMWSIGDDLHSKSANPAENYQVYVYIEDEKSYYYPGYYEGNSDYVIICKGKTLNLNIALPVIAPPVMQMDVEGTLNVNSSNTLDIIGEGHALNVGSEGNINIVEGKTLTLTSTAKINFSTPVSGHKQLTGKGTLLCYSSAINYTVTEDGEITFEDAVQSFIDDGGTLILMDRPVAEELTFYSLPQEFTWTDNNKNKFWSIQGPKDDGTVRNVFIRNHLFSERYYYPCADNVDNVVLTPGTKVRNMNDITIKNFDVQDGAEVIMAYKERKITIDGNLLLHSNGKLSAIEGIVQAYYRVKTYDNLVFDGKEEDKDNLVEHNKYFTTHIATHMSPNARIWVSSHPEGSINFYSQHVDGEKWGERDRFSIIPDANVYLYIEGEYYYPGRLSYYQDDAIVIPEGKKVSLDVNISGAKSVGNLHIDGELMYKNSDKTGLTLKTVGDITGKGTISTAKSGKSILHVLSMDNWKVDDGFTNELLDHATLTTGNVYVTKYVENLTYYFAGSESSNWNNWENWRLDKDLKRVYAYIEDKYTYPTSDYDTDIAVIGVAGATRNDVVATEKEGVLGGKKLNGLTVNSKGTLDIDTHELTISKSFMGDGRIQSKYVDGIVLSNEIAAEDKLFCKNGVIFVSVNPYIFYSLKGMDGWGDDVPGDKNNWKTDTRYSQVNWSVIPNTNAFVYSGNKYYVPSTNDEAHIVGGKTVNVFATGSGQRREIKDLYVEGGTLNICGGRLVVTGKYTFRAGYVHLCAPTDEWVLNEVDYSQEDDKKGLIHITSDNKGDGVMYMTEEFLSSQTSWPQAFNTYRGKIYLANLNQPRKYYLKSGSEWSSAVWTVDRTIDEPGKLVSPIYPGQRFREDEVVITKSDGVAQSLSHNVNMVVKGIDIREECELTSAFDMEIDEYLIGGGKLTAKSIAIEGVDVCEAPSTYTIGEKKDALLKDALFVNGEVSVTGSQYANRNLFAKDGAWSTIKWSLRKDGNVYYNDGTQKPSANNDVEILGDVTVDADATIKNLTVAEGATLHVCGGNLTVNGALNVLGSIEICADYTLTVNGSISEGYEGKVDVKGSLILNTTPKYYKTRATGNWSASSTWLVKNGDVWQNATTVPTASDVVTIEHNVKVDGDNTVFVKELHGRADIILSMNTLKNLKVIGANTFFDDGGEIRLSVWDDYTFYAQNDGQTATDWKKRKWAVDPTRKIYSYCKKTTDNGDVPVVSIYQNADKTQFLAKVVINEGVTVDLVFDDSKTLNSLTVNGTLNVNYKNPRTLTVNNNIVIGSKGNLCINGVSQVEAKLYVENSGTISGAGELIVVEPNRIAGNDVNSEKCVIADPNNNGKVLATVVSTPTTYYSSKDGDWSGNIKNTCVWSIVKGKSVVNYTNKTYNIPDATSSVVVSGGTTITLELNNSTKNITNLTVEEGGTLKICNGTLNVYQDLVVDGKIILCDNGNGNLKTKNIKGHGDIILPTTNKLSHTGIDDFEGRVGVTSKDVTFYFASDENCEWEEGTNWQVDKEHEHIFAYDSETNKFYYPGAIKDGRTYNVVVGAGKNVCLNTEVTINSLTVDGNVNVGEKEIDSEHHTAGEMYVDGALLNISGTMDGAGVVTLEYSDNLDVAVYLMQAGTLIVKHYREGTTYYLLESGGDWTDPYNWTTDPTASVRVNEGNNYPGKTKKNDSVVIPSGRVVTLDKNIIIENLTVLGEVRIKNPNYFLLVANKADGDGKMLVQDINTSFILVDPSKNEFFRNGTVVVGYPCEIPGQAFGGLIIDCNGHARLTDSFKVTNNLEVKSNSTLILGKDIISNPKDINAIRDLAIKGEGLPSEYDVFFESTVGGDVIVEEGAVLKAADYNKDARKTLVDVGGVPTWNVLKVGGSFTVDGELNFANPDININNTHHSVREVDNRAVIKFFGSKNSEFIVNNSASVLSLVCEKDESAILYVNKAEDDTNFDMVSYFCLPDSNYTEYPLVLKSGVLRLGNHMKIKAWGASLRENGNPIGVMQYDVYVPGSDIPVYHTDPWSNSEINEAVRKSHEGTWIDNYKNLYLQLSEIKISKDEEDKWHLNKNKQMHKFDAYQIFKNDMNNGMFIPANATLWIDGAEVEVGRGSSTGLSEKGQYIGHVALQGKLKITQGGKLILPNKSVGIIYDNPDGKIKTPASISIIDGEIHTSRIYGLHGRKLDFNMEGGTLYFDRKTNSNSTIYDKFYTDYGNGDIKQGKPQGCTFSMANGGDFNMSGGSILFYNRDNAEMFAISALDLNDCGGQISGGTIAFADYKDDTVDNSNYSIYLGNHKLHNLTVTTKNSVVFHGNRRSDDGTRGYKGASLYVNGDLTINKNDANRVLVPENLYVGGNMYITQTGNKMPIFGSYGDWVTPAPAPNLYIIGDRDTWMELVAKDHNCVPIFNSLTINKTLSDYNFTIKGKPVFLLGSLDVQKGELITNTTKFTDYRDGVILGNLKKQSYVPQNQTISVGTEGSVSNATISMIANSPLDSDLEVLSDVVVKNFYSEDYRRIILGSNNFKVAGELKMKYKEARSMFVCTDDNANGGLTLKVDMAADNMVEMPVGVSYIDDNGGLSYSYTRCKAKAATAVSGYLTAIPCSNYHPSIPISGTTTKFYWRMKWDGTAGDKIFSYDFRLPGVKQKVVAIEETQTKRCGDHTCHDPSHTVERDQHPDDFELYTHYYQYHNLQWHDCVSVKVDKMSGDGFPTFPAGEIISPNGDFTDGYHFDTNEPKTYYSISDGMWNSIDTWSLKEDVVVKPDIIPTVADKVVIRRGHKITTAPNKPIKAAQIEFVASENSDNMSTLIVDEETVGDKETVGNSVASIIGEGKLIYNVSGVEDGDDSNNWSITARLKEVNYLNGDHSEFCNNTSSWIVFNNESDEEFYLPSVIRTYPNLQTEGAVTIKKESAPQGIDIKGDLIVNSGTLNIGCASGRKNHVYGRVVVKSGATLNVNGDITIDGIVENNGVINVNSGTMALSTDIEQNGTMTVGDATLSFIGNKKSDLSGNKVTFGSNSLLVVAKDDESLTAFIGSQLQSDYILNTSFTRGKVVLGNDATKITLASYSNGGRSNYFDIPSTLTLDVENGDITLWGSDVQGVRLDGSLIAASDSKLSIVNGLGYTSSGTATLSLTGTSNVSVSQIAPCGESGKLNYSQTADAKLVIGKENAALFETRYGRLDIRGGSFTMASNAIIEVKSVADGNNSTIYYAPDNSDINGGSSIYVDMPQGSDAEHPMTTAYIYSEYPLQGMWIGEYTDVNVKTKPLTFNSTLKIDGSLITNGTDLTLNGNFEVNGKYEHGNNTTTLSGSGVQTISGGISDLEFYNLEKTSSSTVNVTLDNPIVSKKLRVAAGIVAMKNSPLKFTGEEMFVDYGSAITGKGVWFNGTSQQTMYCEGTLSIVNVDNAAGVNASTMQSQPITISNSLTLTNGIFRIGNNMLVLEKDATITNGNGIEYGLGKMICTNLALADKGIRVYVPDNASGSKMLPIGNGNIYSPVTIDITSLKSTDGYFEVRPINDYYIGVNDQTLDEDGTPIKDHILDFNWYINSNGISDYKGTVTFEANGVHVNGYNHTHQEGNYIVAVYFDGKTQYDRANSLSSIVPPTEADRIKFTYEFEGDKNVGGFYLAGCYNAIPEYPKAYISVTDGVLTSDDPSLTAATWKEYDLSESKIKESAPFTLTSSKIYGSHIIIASDVTLATNEQRLSSVNIEAGGILRVGKTRAHYFGVMSGTGTLQLESGNMPSANYDRFLDKDNGGTLEFAGDTEYNIMYSFTQVRNLKLSGTGKREFMSAKNTKLDINGDYTIDGPVAYSDADIRLHGDMIVSSGSLEGTGTYIFCGNDKQNIDVTGELTLSGVEVANNKGVEVLHDAELKVSKRLLLTNGKLVSNVVTLTSYNTTITGSATSYIDGWLYRTMNTGSRYEYHIGDGSRYGRSALEVTSQGVWGVKFHNQPIIDEASGYSAQSIKGVPLKLNSEYWEVKRKSLTGNAMVTITWDSKSKYKGTQNTYQAYYSTDLIPQAVSTWKEAETTAKSGSTSGGEVTLKNGTIGFEPAASSMFFAIGEKVADVKVWSGKTDDWFDVINWEDKRLPNASQEVYITTGSGEKNPVIRYRDGKIAQANTIWIKGADSHLTIENGGKLINYGSIVVEDKDNCHVTIKHHYQNMCTVKLNDGYFETIEEDGKRSNANTYEKVRVELALQRGRYSYVGSATFAGTLEQKPTVLKKYNIVTDKFENVTVAKVESDYQYGFATGEAGDFNNTWTMAQVGKVMASGEKTLTVRGEKWDDGVYKWDLLSNPFTFAFPLGDGSITYSDNIDPVIWFRCFNSKLTQFYFSTYSLYLHVGVATGKDAVSEKNAYMAPQQAFFIRPKSGESGTITFNAEAANVGSIPNNSLMLKSAVLEDNDVLRLTVSSQGKNTDEVAFVFRDGGSKNAVYGDAEKKNLASSQNQISGTKQGIKMVIPYYPAVEDMVGEMVPLYVELASSVTSGVLKATNMMEFNTEYNVYLHDLAKKVVVNLRNTPEYSFDTTEGSLNGRFAISLQPSDKPEDDQEEEGGATSVTEALADDVVICKCDADHVLVVPTSDDNAIVTVYDIMGRVVNREKKVTTSTRISLGENKGVYIVEYVSKRTTKSVKVLK